MRDVRNVVPELAKAIRAAVLSVPAPSGSKRPSTKALYAALKKTVRPVVEKSFGGPVFCRYSGCPEGPAKSYSKTPEKVFKVLEYLWDFSLSRYSIPQAIGDPQATLMKGGQFELLFVAESELGTQNEICRDLLKLLDARTSVRCLIYRQPKRPHERQQLKTRMVRVMQSHAYFFPSPGVWLFAGLTWGAQRIECTVQTLSQQQDSLVIVETA